MIIKKPVPNLAKLIRNTSDLVRVSLSPGSRRPQEDISLILSKQKFIRRPKKLQSRELSQVTLNLPHNHSRNLDFVDKWLRRSPTPKNETRPISPSTPNHSYHSLSKQRNCNKISKIVMKIEDLQTKNKILKKSASKNSQIIKKNSKIYPSALNLLKLYKKHNKISLF